MNREIAFLLLLSGGLLVVCLGVGLVISAFVARKPTKAGRVRAVIGGVLIAACTAAYFVFIK